MAKKRCSWCEGDELMVAYHDEEWGFPVRDDAAVFEKLTLESFQSGLSWRTILHKREHFRRAFRGFDLKRVAKFGAKDITRLLGDEGIVRHRGKIEAAIHNAGCALRVIETEGSMAEFFWNFPGSKAKDGTALSKELARRDFRFVGPTTVYAFMQAMGLVNDHAPSCFVRAKAARSQRSLFK
ncbi:MAG: DNA-3-methyladenine glycosylase I [Myxococcaceae bacterium]